MNSDGDELLRPPWIVRMIGPRPAVGTAARVREVLRRTLWIIPVEFLISGFLALAGLPPGNAGEEEIGRTLELQPLRIFVLAVLVAPPLEELIFRGLPSRLSDWILRTRQGSRWPLGILTALGFAAMHSVKWEADADTIELLWGMHFHTDGFPIPQLVFGLLLWDFVRRYGVWACALSHMVHNLVLLIWSFLMLQLAP